MAEYTEKQLSILNIYVKLFAKKKRLPTKVDMQEAGIKTDVVRRAFGGHIKLKEEALKYSPDSFVGLVGKSTMGREEIREIHREIAKSKKFVISTVVSGGQVNVNLLSAIKSYCDKNEAKLLILPIGSPTQTSLDGEFFIDPVLKDSLVVLDDVRLNDNLHISSIKVSAKMINPLQGLRRIGQRAGSFIFASPKQFLESVPVSNTKLPSLLLTPGALTSPNYSDSSYIGKRTATIARNDHVMGGLIVEIESNRVFHVRQIQMGKDGGFVDLGNYYHADGSVSKMAPAAITLGDWHATQVDEEAKSDFFELAKFTGANEFILHDVYSGCATNHHEWGKVITQASKANSGQLDMLAEFKQVAKDLKEMLTVVDKVKCVKSNHDEFLLTYLEAGNWLREPANASICLKLAEAMLAGEDVLKFAVEMTGILDESEKKRIVWLKREDDYKVAGVQCSNHGDKGANGSRGSAQSLENAFGRVCAGHAHSPKIVRGCWIVGTTSKLNLGYNTGSPSGWCHSSVLIYPNSSMQMVFSIFGHWKV